MSESDSAEGVRLDGKAAAAALEERVAAAAARLETQPTLAVILVGERGDSASYVRMKEAAAARVGVVCRVERIPAEGATTEGLVARVRELAADDTLHGIIVQLPLPGEQCCVLFRVTKTKAKAERKSRRAI